MLVMINHYSIIILSEKMNNFLISQNLQTVFKLPSVS